MLRFFRQIRQRLLTDNKFSKYLLYAIGEILLVVLGILIALQIDNWNEQKAINRDINHYLSALIKDMKLDIGSLQASRRYHVFRVHSGIYLLKQHDPELKLSFLPDNSSLPESGNRAGLGRILFQRVIIVILLKQALYGYSGINPTYPFKKPTMNSVILDYSPKWKILS